MKTCIRNIILSVLFFCLSDMAYSQWKPSSGLDGVLIYSIGGVDSTLIIKSYNKVLTHRLNENSWSEINTPGYDLGVPFLNKYLLSLSYLEHNLYFSNDVGVSWEVRHIFDAACNGICAIDSCIFVHSGDTLFKSVDHGYTWTPVSFIPANSKLRSAGTILFYYTLYNPDLFAYSEDKGVTWNSLPPLEVETNLNSILVLNGKVFINTSTPDSFLDHFFELDTIGYQWINMDFNILPRTATYFDGNIYATNEGRGIYKLDIANQFWSIEDLGIDTLAIVIALYPFSDRLFAAIEMYDLYQYQSGQNWSRFDLGLNCRNLNISVVGENVWALDSYGHLFYSSDHGKSFTNTLMNGIFSFGSFEGILYFVTHKGYFESYDLGKTFNKLTNLDLNANVVRNHDYLYKMKWGTLERCSLADFQWHTILPSIQTGILSNHFLVQGLNVYLLSENYSWIGPPGVDTVEFVLKKSDDNGDHFQDIMKVHCAYNDLRGKPFLQASNKLYLNSCDFLSSTDQGVTWSSYPSELSSHLYGVTSNYEATLLNKYSSIWLNLHAVDSVFFDITDDLQSNQLVKPLSCCGLSGRYILAGLENNGIYYRDDLLTGSQNASNLNNAKMNIYPNPSRGPSYVRLESECSGKGVIRLFDLSGRICSEQIAWFALGENQIKLNLDGLSPGMYHVQIVTSSGSNISPIIIE